MNIKITKNLEVEIKTLHVEAGVRYWEDALVDGVEEDEFGGLIPFHSGDRWCPVIDLDSGTVMNWPQGTVADVYYKVCDDGRYTLKDAAGRTVARHDGYVPNFFPGQHCGDYLILQIDTNGKIAHWPERIDLAGFITD